MPEPDFTVPDDPPTNVFAPLVELLRETVLEPGHAVVATKVEGDVHLLHLSFVVGVSIPPDLPDDHGREVIITDTGPAWLPLTGRTGRARVGAELLADDMRHTAGLIERWCRTTRPDPTPDTGAE